MENISYVVLLIFHSLKSIIITRQFYIHLFDYEILKTASEINQIPKRVRKLVSYLPKASFS